MNGLKGLSDKMAVDGCDDNEGGGAPGEASESRIILEQRLRDLKVQLSSMEKVNNNTHCTGGGN